MSTLDKETEQSLLSQLVKLGDMIGDGLDREPDGFTTQKRRYWNPSSASRMICCRRSTSVKRPILS